MDITKYNIICSWRYNTIFNIGYLSRMDDYSSIFLTTCSDSTACAYRKVVYRNASHINCSINRIIHTISDMNINSEIAIIVGSRGEFQTGKQEIYISDI